MAAVLSNISNIIIPVILFYIVAYGISNRCNVYEDFIRGAKDGFHTVIQIMPTLIGLYGGGGRFAGIGVSGICRRAVWRRGGQTRIFLRAGAADVVKMFSSSAATGLVLDILKPWAGFPDWAYHLHYDELHGDNLLYYERLLSGGEGHKDPLVR